MAVLHNIPHLIHCYHSLLIWFLLHAFYLSHSCMWVGTLNKSTTQQQQYKICRVLLQTNYSTLPATFSNYHIAIDGILSKDGQEVQAAKTKPGRKLADRLYLISKTFDLKTYSIGPLIWKLEWLGWWIKFPQLLRYFLLILTFRVHCSLPSGRGISCGKRRGSSNSPRDVKGDGRCRLSGWMLMLSCLATCR